MSDRKISTRTKLLQAAKAKIDRPEKWCKGALARTSQGKEICANQLTGLMGQPIHAHSYCIHGAMYMSYLEMEYRDGNRAARRDFDAADRLFKKAIESPNIPGFNDASWVEHEEVMLAFDSAIAYSVMADHE